MASNDFLIYAAGGNVYHLQGNGLRNSHNVGRGIRESGNTRTISIYLRQHFATWAQIAVVQVFNFHANFNLSSCTLGNRDAISSAISTPLNGWYRWSMTFAKNNATTMILYIVSASKYIGGELNFFSSGFYVSSPHIEGGSTATG